MEDQDGLRIDRNKYRETYSPEEAPEPKASRPKRATRKRTAVRALEVEEPLFDLMPEPQRVAFEEVEVELADDEEDYRDIRHNEIEDFLL